MLDLKRTSWVGDDFIWSEHLSYAIGSFAFQSLFLLHLISLFFHIFHPCRPLLHYSFMFTAFSALRGLPIKTRRAVARIFVRGGG